MIFTPLSIPGSFLIEHEPFEDARGRFYPMFDAHEWGATGMSGMVARANLSVNTKAQTFRGFHGQRAPHAEPKTLSAITGRFTDYMIDLRPGATYGRCLAKLILPGFSIHVPKGCANAILTGEDDTRFFYLVGERFHPESEYGIRWNDPMVASLNIPEPTIISEKDRNHPDWEA